MHEVTKLIRKRLIDKGMTQNDLAEKLNISPAYMSNIIRFGYSENIDRLKSICGILEIGDYHYFLCWLRNLGKGLKFYWS